MYGSALKLPTPDSMLIVINGEMHSLKGKYEKSSPISNYSLPSSFLLLSNMAMGGSPRTTQIRAFLPFCFHCQWRSLSRRKYYRQRSSVAGCLHSTGFSLTVPLSLYLPFCLPLSHRGHNDVIPMSLIKEQENNEWGCRTATETQPLCLSLTEVEWAQSGVEQYGSCK